MLDLLFKYGYEYIPWTLSDKSELTEAAATGNIKKLNYLIEHGVPVDYRTEEGITALGVAMYERNTELVFALLAAGADPNASPNKYKTSVELALFRKNPELPVAQENIENIILLLASGLEITDENLEPLREEFKDDTSQIDFIINHAVKLNRKLLGLPDVVNLDDTNSKEIIGLLQNAKLIRQLGMPLDNVVLIAGGKSYFGKLAMEKIAQYYKAPGKMDLVDFNQKTEIYKLLKFFKPESFEFKGSTELINLITQIAKNITSKPIAEHSIDDLFEIEVIMDKLMELSGFKFSIFHPTKIHLSYNASAALSSIEKYLASNGVDSIEEYIATQSPDTSYKARHLFFSTYRQETADTVAISFKRDIAPLLR